MGGKRNERLPGLVWAGVAVLVAAVLALCCPVSAEELLVPSQYGTIQAAIDAAGNGDTVIVADGTYTGDGNRDIDFLGKAIILRSTDPNDHNVVAATIIDCQQQSRAFYFHNGEGPDSILEGFTITNGSAYYGGGIWCRYSSSPTISNCIIRGNVATVSPGHPGGFATDGGGIYCYESSATIDNCYLLDNIATANGGAISSYYGNVLVRNCVFSRNKAMSGGAIAIYEDNMSIQNCLITGNSSIYKYYGGGGIYCSRSAATISNCTISGNRAHGYGGGIYVLESDATVANSVLWGNSAAQGPEIALGSGAFGPASLTISYTDTAGGVVGIDIDPSCTLDWGSGNIDADPCFADAGYWDPNGAPNDVNDDFWVAGDYHLQSQAGRWDPNTNDWIMDANTSVCIDAGDMASPIGYEPFPNGGRVNMGAYGGTDQASKSYFGQPPCQTIIAGDINGDCRVNYFDFAIMAIHWLECTAPGDPNCIVKDGIEYCIQTDKAVYNLGENVQMSYRVTNLGDKSVTFGFTHGPEYRQCDFIIERNGETIWDTRGWPVTYVITHFTLEPSQSREYSQVWDMTYNDGGPILPGEYSVTGELDQEILYPERYVPVSVQIEIVP